MRLAAALLLAASTVGCMGREADEEPASAETELVVYVWRSGPQGPASNWTIRCPSRSGNEREERACERLAQLGRQLFEPVPKDTICSDIYGGPAVADVDGTLDGEPLSAHFNRSNGCEIARWNRASFLFSPG